MTLSFTAVGTSTFLVGPTQKRSDLYSDSEYFLPHTILPPVERYTVKKGKLPSLQSLIY